MGQPNSSHEHYTYNDDFNPETSIRLLKILDVSTDEDRLCAVSCKLVPWSLGEEDIPRFKAISYTWGDQTDPNNQSRILIKNRVLMVTKNCEDALKQAWTYRREAWYWIDSICIDQHNRKEKAFQVPLMSSIFGTAEHVLACVGQHANRSEELFRFIEDRPEILHPVPPPDQPLIVHDLYLQTRLGGTLENFLTRPYFTRVWIFQELHLATKVEFLCGPDLVSAKRIWALSRHIPDLPTTRALLEVAVSPGKRKISLKDALHAVENANLQCHFVVDKIFGVLAVVDWQDKARIVPDYQEMDVFNLAVTVLDKILELEGRVPQTNAYQTARLVGGLLGVLDRGSTFALDAAINRRRSSISTIDPRKMLQTHPEESRIGDAVMCHGWRIRNEGSHWALEGYQKRLDIQVPSTSAAKDKGKIWLPQRTEPGDWYLVPNPYSAILSHILHGLVLVVRRTTTRTDPECYNIIGIGFDHGLAAKGMRITADYDHFGVIASCEDRLFLLMAIGVYHQEVDKQSSQESDPWPQISAVLGAGPCGAKDFSFAFSVPWPGH